MPTTDKPDQYIEDWAPDTTMQQLRAAGHLARKGHAFAGYYATTTDPGIVRLVPTCCEED